MSEDYEHKITQPRFIVSMSLRWIARAMSILLILYIFVSVVGAPAAIVRGFDTSEGVTIISLIIMGFGLIIAWFRGGVGGSLVLFGYLLMMIAEGAFIVNWALVLIPVSGLMFLIAAVLDKGKPNRLRF